MDRFREILANYAVQEGYALTRIKNEPLRVIAKCANENCLWRIHATALMDKITYKVKKYVPGHTCERLDKIPEVTSTWITKKFEDMFRTNLEMKIDVLMGELK